MIVMDGKQLSEKILNELRQNNISNKNKAHLVVIIVGNNTASKIYVRNKKIAAEKAGINATVIEYDETISENELLSKINELNNDSEVTGILVQLPLPPHIDKNKVAMTISPKKDVDGFSPENVGRLAIGLEPYFYPATPQGILMLLDEYKVPIAGANVVVIGRSNIVGKPVAQMLLKRNATVTICHSYTKDLDNIIKTADIVISAVGKKIVRCKMGNKNSCIVDVGIFRDTNSQLTGDVDFNYYMSNQIGYISPVPGGVGPMTIASLMTNASKVYVN